MLKFFHSINGSISYSVTTLNWERHLKNLTSRDIELMNIKKNSINNCHVSIKAKNNKDFIKYFENKAELEVLKTTGLVFLKNFFKVNLVVLIIFIMCLSSFPFLNLFIWNIKIYGLEKISKQEIISTLKQQNITKGKLSANVDKEKMQVILMNTFENIAMCEVKQKGTVIVVNIREITYPSNVDVKYVNLVSKYDAIIEHITVTSGTPVVKKGDIVKAGEVLVGAYIIRGERKIEAQAIAEIKIRAFYKEESYFFENKQEEIRTGNKATQNYFTLFKNFDIIKCKTNKYLLYETVVLEKDILISSFLPIKLTKVEFYELKTITVTQSFTEKQEEEEQQLLTKAKNSTSADVFLNEKVESYLVEPGIYKTVVNLEFELTV